MRGEFHRLWLAVVVGVSLLALVETLRRLAPEQDFLLGSLGFFTLVAWAVVAVRLIRTLVFEYLFASSMREGVPLLLVDLFTLGVSLILAASILHTVFLIEVTSILATSAVASIVLGLALQDTLGQLFAGISLQLDKPFRMGDWIEVRMGAERMSGQVQEVSWRATMLLAISEELITIPNKTMAQSQILNFSGRARPFIRSHLFRLPLSAPLALAKATLLEAAVNTPGVLAAPAPLPLLIETTESWVSVKLLYFIADYGGQFTVADAFLERALELLAKRGIALASDRMAVELNSTTSSGASTSAERLATTPATARVPSLRP